MGMDLVRGTDVFSVSAMSWHECLELAITFGWRPAGTLYPIADLSILDDRPDVQARELERRKRDWTGMYTSNDWQRVTDVDAMALAAALKRAIQSIQLGEELTPDQQDALRRMATEEDTEDSEDFRTIRRPVRPSYLNQIANFVGEGAFEIG